MNFQNVVLLVQAVLVVAVVVVTVYKNKTGKYTAGLPWPLEPIAVLLNNLAKQPWQPKYFNSIIEHAVLPAVYTGVFKMIGGRLHILLTPRSDEYWKDVVHVPGSIARASDRPGEFEDALARVQKGELKGLAYLEGPIFAGCGLVKTNRCKECYVVFVAFTNRETNIGRFYPVDNLPQNLIDHERDVVIPAAVEMAKKLTTALA